MTAAVTRPVIIMRETVARNPKARKRRTPTRVRAIRRPAAARSSNAIGLNPEIDEITG